MKRGFAIGIVFWGAVPGLVYSSGGASTSLGPQVQLVARQGSSRPHPAVVRVVAPGRGSISYGSGTLVAVNEKHGLVITNWHVVNEATAPISVIFPDGFQSAASVLKVDRDWDLAALAIWKPNVEPVPLASAAPRSGEMLTIAGYGSGSYREATGRCTQYVAPGTRFPYEMVELSAAARQGDSGGPIFNDRGQLAGVLFGEGQGRTAGSYCGRVQWFLTSIAPTGRQADAPMFVAIPGQQDSRAGQPTGSSPQDPRYSQSNPGSSQPSARYATAEPPRAQPSAPTFAAANAAQGPAAREPSNLRPSQGSTSIPALPRASGMPVASSSQPQYVGWREIAGDTIGEQIKTILAGVGALALVLHTLAWLSGERRQSKK